MDNDFILKEFQQEPLNEIQGNKPDEPKEPKEPKRFKKPKPIWREYLEVILISLTAAILLRLFLVSAYRVESASMEDTLLEGDYIFINKLAYDFSEPKIGDIIIFQSPTDFTRDYIKRIIALPGQTVEIIDKIVYVDNHLGKIIPDAKNIDPKILAAQLSNRDNFGPVKVPEGHLFVLGDNRDISEDSRFWGFVPMESVKGRAMLTYWSWNPEESSPEWSFPYIQTVFEYAWYFVSNIFSETRWSRMFVTL